MLQYMPGGQGTWKLEPRGQKYPIVQDVDVAVIVSMLPATFTMFGAPI